MENRTSQRETKKTALELCLLPISFFFFHLKISKAALTPLALVDGVYETIIYHYISPVAYRLYSMAFITSQCFHFCTLFHEVKHEVRIPKISNNTQAKSQR